MPILQSAIIPTRGKGWKQLPAYPNPENIDNNQPHYKTDSTMEPEAIENATTAPTFVVEDLMVITGGAAGTKTVSFTVRGNPPVQQRSRIAWKGLIGGWVARRKPIIYDPSASLKEKYAAQVRDAMVAMDLALPSFSSGYNDDGLIMELNFFIERPETHYNVLGNRVRANAPKYPKVKDVDNMEKFVSDALHGIVYNNDNMIRKSITEKAYSPEGGAGFTEVVFRDYI
jgi:hypothetical protein